MNRVAAKAIGDDVGEFMEVDADGGDSAVGRALRIKIRLDVRKSLRRCILVDLGANKGERWCPITYEHLLDFCYVCGLIGHVDRACSKKLGKNEPAPCSRELRYIPPRKPMGYKNQESSSLQSGRGGGSGLWRAGRSDSWSSGGKSRSDGPSWRKDSEKGSVKVIEGKKNDDEEVTSPLKEVQHKEQSLGAVKKGLFQKEGSAAVQAGQAGAHSELYVNNTMQDMQLVPAAKAKEGEKERTGGKFKRIKRDDKLPVGEKSTKKIT
jgi:hypothetical protein